MSRVNPYVLLDYAYVIIYDCLCFRLNKPKVRFTTLAYKYLVCAKEAALRRLRIIATIYSAFYRSIQHDENKEWQLANCVNRNFNPSVKPAGKKQLITLDKLVWTRTKQKKMLEAMKRYILGLAGGFNFQRNMPKILKLKIRETKISFSD